MIKYRDVKAFRAAFAPPGKPVLRLAQIGIPEFWYQPTRMVTPKLTAAERGGKVECPRWVNYVPGMVEDIVALVIDRI